MRALGWTAAGVLIGAGALGMAGCKWDRPQNTEVHTYTVSGAPTRLDVTNHLGHVEVVAGDGPIQVTETWRFDDAKPTTTHGIDGDTLRLSENGCERGHACQVDYRVRVPAATAVTAKDTAGAMTLTGITGDIDVTDTAGRIDGTGLGAKNTVVRDSAGAIDLRYTAVPDSVDAHDSAGSITIRVPDSVAYHVDAHTTAGKTSVDIPQDGSSPHRIVADDTAGAITIGRA